MRVIPTTVDDENEPIGSMTIRLSNDTTFMDTMWKSNVGNIFVWWKLDSFKPHGEQDYPAETFEGNGNRRNYKHIHS